MIVFDLKCASGHVFEAWFGSSGDFEDQRSRGLLACPICDCLEVGKAAMAPAVPTKGNRGSDGAAEGGTDAVPMEKGTADPEKVKRLLGELAREQAKMLEKSDYVGKDFARQARAMHDGETDDRPIHGETSIAEARSMIEDGIPVAPLPLPVRRPEEEN